LAFRSESGYSGVIGDGEFNGNNGFVFHVSSRIPRSGVGCARYSGFTECTETLHTEVIEDGESTEIKIFLIRALLIPRNGVKRYLENRISVPKKKYIFLNRVPTPIYVPIFRRIEQV
jgi:hypothetical protein